MKVNSQQIKLEKECSIRDFLEKQNYNIQHIAVELNGEIVSKKKFEAITLKDDDEVEIVSFVGGG